MNVREPDDNDNRMADPLHDQDRIHHRLTEHLQGSCRDDHSDDGEHQEVDRQAEEIAHLHCCLAFAESREVPKIQQKRAKISDDEYRGI
jgi:hypothetical protein